MNENEAVAKFKKIIEESFNTGKFTSKKDGILCAAAYSQFCNDNGISETENARKKVMDYFMKLAKVVEK